MIPEERKLPPRPLPVRLARLLLVEGETPKHFCEALLRHLGLHDGIEVRSYGGNADLKRFLEGLASTTEFKTNVRRLAVVRDAETDARAALQAVRDAMDAAQLPGRVQTSIFILPDNENPGMLETLCIQSAKQSPATTAVFTCVEQFFDCLTGQNVPIPDPSARAKHEAQVFLATRPEAQLFPGQAAYKGYWPWDAPSFDRLREFLQELGKEID